MKSGKKNFIEKISNSILNVLIVIFGIILLISIYTGVQTKILGNDYTNFFGYSIFEVQTGSMADTIDAGDWIIVKLTQKVKLNDIVTYELGDEYITHRIIEVYNNTFITKGDANNAKDEPVDKNQIIGKVVNVLSSFGILRKTLFNPSVLVAIVITILLFNYTVNKNKGNNDRNNPNGNSRSKNNHSTFDNITKKITSIFSSNRKFKNNSTNEKINDILNIDSEELEKYKKVFGSSSRNDGKSTEDELEKTAIYRAIPVDSGDVSDKYKIVTEKVETKKVEKEKPTEEDLDKTALYRVISVDLSENEDNKKEEIKKEVKKSEAPVKPREEDLEKTMFFRVIPVDASETERTLQEIEKNKMKKNEEGDTEKNVPQKKQEKLNEDEDEDNEALTKIKLDLLKNKKSKNVIDKVMLIKKDELDELVNILLDHDKLRVNEPTIKEELIDIYIDARYYNFYADKEIEHSRRNSISKMEKIMKLAAEEMINNYQGSDNKYDEKVETIADIFILIATFEKASESISDLKERKEYYKKHLENYSHEWDDQKISYIINKILKIQKNYSDTLEYFMEQIETDIFNLKFNNIVSERNMYGLELEHNIPFSKVYSDYIIDKTYSEGIIAEDKLPVIFNLLLVQMIKDMTSSNVNQRYILYIPKSLYAKVRKIKRLLRLIDDKYAKNNIFILITITDLLKNKQIVKKLRKMGYRFALVFNEDTEVPKKERGNIYIADYIFINKNNTNIKKILSSIPGDLVDRVIYEDIEDKVGDFGDD